MARPRSAAARLKMLQAAQEIITMHGLDGFTVDEVARRSGVAKTTIYRHFSSGDELALAAIDAMVEEIPTPDTGSLRGDLEAVVGSFVAMANEPTLRQLFLSILNRATVDEDFAARFRAFKDQRHVAVRTAIQRAIARGEVAPDIDIELALHLVQGPFMAKRLIDGDDVSERELEQLLDLIERALVANA